MRILQVAHAFPPTVGGVETHLWDLGHALARRGHALTFLVGSYPGSAAENHPHDRIVVERHECLSVSSLIDQRDGLPSSQLRYDLLRLHTDIFSDILQRCSPDVIHLHNAHHFAPELAHSAPAVAAGRPIFNSVHDRVGAHIYDQILEYAWTGVIYASRYLCEALPTSRPRFVRHLPVDTGTFSAIGPADPRMLSLEKPVIFHPARLLRWKGVLVGLNAFARVRERLHRGTLVLCESGNTVEDQEERAAFRAEIESRACDLGISDHVRFLPFGRDEMSAAYRASDVVWYPTIEDEPLGLVPMEAYACRVPLIVSRSGGMVETVEDGVTGLIVEKNDENGLADAALTILQSETLGKRLTAAGTLRMPQFSVERYAEAIEEVYGWT